MTVWRWAALPVCLVAEVVLLSIVFAVNRPDLALGRSASGDCTVTVVPDVGIYLVFWLFSLAATTTAAVAVLSARWVFSWRRNLTLRIAAVALATIIAGVSMLAAVVVPVSLHDDTVPRTVACRGG